MNFRLRQPQSYRNQEPEIVPATEPPRDLYASLKEGFAAMSVSEREAAGAGKCHLHPPRCNCYWCETAAQRTADRLKADSIRDRYGWG